MVIGGLVTMGYMRSVNRRLGRRRKIRYMGRRRRFGMRRRRGRKLMRRRRRGYY